ncbi:MAG: EpsI family protein [Planctomycetes bacterium]|nr:EpsI family protein [Planctomycetota bacterium]
MLRTIPLVIACVLIASVAVVHGMMTQRWTSSATKDLQLLMERYQQVPKVVGDWQADEPDTPVSPIEMKGAGAYSHVSRRYHNVKTGQVVQILLLTGYGRTIAVHTPDVCYPGQGFSMLSSPQGLDLTTGDTKARVMTTIFSKNVPGGTIHQRIFWTWNAGQGWQAPDAPRMKFPGYSPLNKLYLIADTTTDSNVTPDKSSLANFADSFLPTLNKILYPSAQ